MVSVFTPTYNRAYILENLYRSLLEQTSYDFEWIIVDDGSEDGTEELVRSWGQKIEKFPIIYKKTSNGGKHRAINYGVRLAQSEAFFIVDSDDALAKDAISFINAEFAKIMNEDGYAGMSGLKIHKNGEVIGGMPSFDGYVDATNFERGKYSLLGDKAEVYKTSVLKRYPFPEFDNENFLTEAVVWDAIAFDGLKIRWYNKPLYYVEYMQDGLTKNSYDKTKNNPLGWAEWIRREKKYGRLVGKELSNTLFAFIERVNLPENTICEILDLTEKKYEMFFQKKKRLFERINEKISSHRIKCMALYGYGYNAKRLLDYINDMDVEIPYVIDQRFEDITDISAYSLQADLPEVDSVCITLKNPEFEIKNALERKMPNSYIWQLADIEIDR